MLRLLWRSIDSTKIAQGAWIATRTVLLTAPRKLTVIARSPLIDVSSGNLTTNDDNQLKFGNFTTCSTGRS